MPRQLYCTSVWPVSLSSDDIFWFLLVLTFQTICCTGSSLHKCVPFSSAPSSPVWYSAFGPSGMSLFRSTQSLRVWWQGTSVILSRRTVLRNLFLCYYLLFRFVGMTLIGPKVFDINFVKRSLATRTYSLICASGTSIQQRCSGWLCRAAQSITVKLALVAGWGSLPFALSLLPPGILLAAELILKLK